MEAKNRLRIQGNYKALVSELRVQDVVDQLFQDGLLTDEEQQWVQMDSITTQEGGSKTLVKHFRRRIKCELTSDRQWQRSRRGFCWMFVLNGRSAGAMLMSDNVVWQLEQMTTRELFVSFEECCLFQEMMGRRCSSGKGFRTRVSLFRIHSNLPGTTRAFKNLSVMSVALVFVSGNLHSLTNYLCPVPQIVNN